MKNTILIPLLLCIGLVGCNTAHDSSKAERKIQELPVTPLMVKDISIPRGYICDINGFQYVEVHARVHGYLEEILVDEGQMVKKGQPLFRISSNEHKEMVSKAEANLQRAIAEDKTKSLEVDRVRMMVDKKIMSPMELDVALAQKQAAESGIKEAKSVLQNARINLAYTVVRAPFDGIVDRIPFKIGSLINSGTLLTSVSNIDQVYAYFRVSESDYLRFLNKELNRGDFTKQKYKVSLVLADGSPYPHVGQIEAMEGDFDRSTGSIAFRARFPNPDRLLKHGATGKILMHRTLEDAVLVPQESTFSIQDKNYVFVVDRNNVARAKSFRTLDRYENFFVASGLNAGERIVMEGVQALRDGAQIKPKLVRADSTALTKL